MFCLSFSQSWRMQSGNGRYPIFQATEFPCVMARISILLWAQIAGFVLVVPNSTPWLFIKSQLLALCSWVSVHCFVYFSVYWLDLSLVLPNSTPLRFFPHFVLTFPPNYQVNLLEMILLKANRRLYNSNISTRLEKSSRKATKTTRSKIYKNI